MDTHIYTKAYGTPVYETRIPNGSVVYTAPMKSRLVTCLVTYPVGAMEDGDHPGAAHFLEHLMMKGDARDGVHPAIRDLLPKGVEGNAMTDYYTTQYYLTGFVEDFSDIGKALIEVGTHPTFTVAQLEAERGVILQEEREGADRRFTKTWYRKQAYPHVPRLHIPVIGTQDSIQEMRFTDLQDYVRREYYPSRAAFFAAGGITHEEHVELICSSLTAQMVPTDHTSVPRAPYPLTLFSGICRDVRIDTATLALIYHGPKGLEDWSKLGVAEEILSIPVIGILQQKLRGQHRLVYDVQARGEHGPTPYLSIETACEEKMFDRVRELIFEGIEELSRDEYPQAVFDTVMINRRKFFATREEMISREQLINWMEHDWLKNIHEDRDPTAVLQTTRGQIAELIEKYYPRDNYGQVIFAPV